MKHKLVKLTKMPKHKVALIIPLPEKLIDRLCETSRDVIVKYSRRLRHLYSSMPILFYAIKPVSKILAEGVIDSTEYLRPLEALEKYGSRLLLNIEELQQYMQPVGTVYKRGNKSALTIVVRDVSKYKNPVEYHKPGVPSGRYVSEKELRAVRFDGNQI